MSQNIVIFIDKLTINASIGVFGFEKKKKQKLLVSLEAGVEIPEKEELHHSDVVCYDTVAKGIRAIVDSQHFELLETLGKKILDYCLADVRMKRVRIRLEKPDIIADAISVGVEIHGSQA